MFNKRLGLFAITSAKVMITVYVDDKYCTYIWTYLLAINFVNDIIDIM